MQADPSGCDFDPGQVFIRGPSEALAQRCRKTELAAVGQFDLDPLATVVGMLAEGMAEQEILAAYPDLEREDLQEALRYAAEAVRERVLPLVGAE